jgi:Undecaprenyl-phosphate glucose phosphotransferase
MSALTSRFLSFRPARPVANSAQRLRGTSRPALQAHSLVSAGVAFSDLLMLCVLLHVFVAAAAAFVLHLSFQDRLIYTAFGVLAAAALGVRCGLYDIANLLRPRHAVSCAFMPLLAAIAAITFTLAAGGQQIGILLALAVGSLGAGLCALVASREISAGLVRYGIATGRLRYRIAVVGSQSEAVLQQLAAQPSPFVEPVNVFDGTGPRAENPLGAFDDLLSLARVERVDAIILAYPPADADRLELAFTTLRCSVADIFLTSKFARCGTLPAGHPLAALPIMPVQRRAMTDIDTALKGIIDRVAGCTLLVLLSPLLLLTAIAIKLDSKGPVLFRQPRIGYNNAVFMMYKFRSMYDHAADRMAQRQTTRNDSRVTRVGRLIRRLSIDELPQLLNVMRGEMSVVGPRPHAPGTNIEGLLLEHVAAGYPLRHRVLPGITGWAQINGSRGMLSSPEQIRQRVKLDLEYIDRWSLSLDLKIIWLTAMREIWSRHAF